MDMTETTLIKLLTEIKKELLNEYKKTTEELTAELTKIIDAMDKQNEIIKKQKSKIAFLENKLRLKNLIIQGLNEPENENYSILEGEVKNLITQKMGVKLQDCEVEHVQRLGKSKGTKRPICLTVSSTKKIIEILTNKKQLRGSNIYVDRDYSKEDRELRKQLFRDQLKARKEGKYAVVKGTELIVKEKMISKEQRDREKRPLEVSPEQPKEMEEKNQQKSNGHKTKKKFFEKFLKDESPKENKVKGRKIDI